MVVFRIRGMSDCGGKIYLESKNDIDTFIDILESSKKISLQCTYKGKTRVKMFYTKKLLQRIENDDLELVYDEIKTYNKA